MNKVIMTGYVVKDPEVNEFKRKRRRNKRASKYGLVASFRLSVRRPFKTKDGTKYDYFSCSAFDKSAEFIEEYIEKGDCVGIEGILLNDNYENEDGMTMYRDKINLDKIELLRKKKTKMRTITKMRKKRITMTNFMMRMIMRTTKMTTMRRNI